VISQAEGQTAPVVDADEEQRRLKVRRYATWITVLMIVLCNAVFLLGVWGSGVNLNRLIRFPDIFNPTQDVCLRLTWHRVVGSEEPVRLCSEWINLADSSGETHTFQNETKVVQAADGKLYFDHGARADYRLLLFVSFVVALVISGILLKRYLISRYRLRLEMTGAKSPSPIH
jgi:hypothetical protein